MRQIRLGRSDLLVSEVGFGGIPIQRVREDEAVAVVRRCLDLGVTFLDTATGYGTSEERIGKAIAGRREGLVLATKSPARDAATCREHLTLSFRRLGVDYIDLYQFHNVSSDEDFARILAPGGAMEAACEVQAAGRIGHIGVTSHKLEVAQKMVRSERFETIMFPFNLVTDEPATELLPLCRQHDVGFIVMKPFAGGMFDDAALAFKYLRQFPDALILPGIERPWEIEQIVGLLERDAVLTAEDHAAIARVREELGNAFCRRCGYCQPCTAEIDIVMMTNLRSFLKRFPPQDLFGGGIAAAVARAEECVDCGACEPRCPYQLPIRQIVRENVALYRDQRDAYLGAKG
ncbi:MAG: aldo/keto reductase [Anaerolineae bacterium]